MSQGVGLLIGTTLGRRNGGKLFVPVESGIRNGSEWQEIRHLGTPSGPAPNAKTSQGRSYITNTTAWGGGRSSSSLAVEGFDPFLPELRVLSSVQSVDDNCKLTTVLRAAFQWQRMSSIPPTLGSRVTTGPGHLDRRPGSLPLQRLVSSCRR